jgi:hypothetical protein
MSYFAGFPYVQYEFPDGVVRLFKNISIRPAIVEEFFGIASNLETYDVQDGETPETIAYDRYGEAELHWIIMLANNVMNLYRDWPMTTAQFDSYLKGKYVTTTSVLGKTVYLQNDPEMYQAYIEYVGLTDSDGLGTPFATYRDYKDSELADSDYIILRPHHFVDKDGTVYNLDTIDNPPTAFAVEVTPVSIYDWEFSLNEAKRSILIPKGSVVEQLKKELRDLLNE